MIDRVVDLKVKKLEHYDSSFDLPQYETTGAAGADLRAHLENKDSLVIAPGARVLVPTGLSFEIPHGYEVQIRPRSGLSFKTDLLVVNSPGTIDCDYRGEVKIILGNFGKEDFIIKHGERIAQMVMAPVWQARISAVDELTDTERGAGGFGSTGTK
ncbi:dUTP diphosphatase [Halobacteriovorax sp. GFR7]|uniref:dUTP diphosphatase n=1 Tax=unclassified Halobacteriovorax TaxID=2639665 RepID=UPI003D96D2A1